MAGASGLDMAVAVSEAGGLGSLPCALLDPPALEDALAAARARTDRPIQFNFFAHDHAEADPARDGSWLGQLDAYYREFGVAPPTELSPGPVQGFADAHCAILEANPPAVVSFHFGLPEDRVVRRLKAAGIVVMGSATTVDEARWLKDNGCDAVIAQGNDGGGHRGMFLTGDAASQIGTFSLVPQVVDAVDVPVIAAGGIADGRGVAAAMALGADGVQVGTAFLLTEEAEIGPLYRSALMSPGAATTAVTNLFSGRPARCIANRLVCEKGPIAADAATFPRGFAALAPIRHAAEARGSADFSALYCGQAAGLAKPATAGQLTLDLATTARDCAEGLHHRTTPARRLPGAAAPAQIEWTSAVTPVRLD